MPSLDLEAQNLSTFQTNQQIGVRTITAAATIAPTTFLTVVVGAGPVSNIVPPASGVHMLVIIPSAALALTVVAPPAGNIAAAVTGAINVPILLFYNPNTKLYTAGSIRATATAG